MRGSTSFNCRFGHSHVKKLYFHTFDIVDTVHTFDIVDTVFTYERELIVCSVLQDFSKRNGSIAYNQGHYNKIIVSLLQLICNAHTLRFFFEGQM